MQSHGNVVTSAVPSPVKEMQNKAKKGQKTKQNKKTCNVK